MKIVNKSIEKADILIEALPYISKFNGKTVVIKYGGSAMTDSEIKKLVIGDISFMKMIGISPIIIHGGGPSINDELEKENIKPKFKDGIRITDEKTIKIVETVLSGKVNKSIVSDFQRYGLKAVGISGKDGFLLECKKHQDNIGFVGEITNVNTKIIETLVANDFVPVISPIGTDKTGNTYNVNADYAAVEIAIALKALKLVFMTDVDGLRKIEDKADTLISRISPEDAEKLIENGTITGGMKPKTKCCIKAVQNGVNSVHILNGKIKHSLLLEIYTKNGIGTIIEAKGNE